MNMPIYRAKRIDSDEYVIGFYSDIFFMCGKNETGHYITDILSTNGTQEDIDPSTLSIHFPDMLDSDDNKIFASLSENGKGGDIFQSLCYKDEIITAKYINREFIIDSLNDYQLISTPILDELKTIGIRK